jgi:hypothetical protein
VARGPHFRGWTTAITRVDHRRDTAQADGGNEMLQCVAADDVPGQLEHASFRDLERLREALMAR